MTSDEPNEAERCARIAEQRDDQYLVLGRFIAKYEQLCDRVRFGINHLLLRNGLNDEDLGFILLAKVESENLRQIFVSALAHCLGRDGIKASLFDEIDTRMKRLQEARNEVVHNPLFIGWASQTDQNLGPARGYRHSRPKTGYRTKQLVYSTQKLTSLGDEAAELDELVSRIASCVVGGFEIERNFTRDDATERWLPVSSSGDLP